MTDTRANGLVTPQATSERTPLQVGEISYFRYKLPLKKPLHVGPDALTHREGFVVVIRDVTGHIGRGEISPLPHFHHETLAQAQSDLVRVSHFLQDQVLRPASQDLDVLSERQWKELDVAPSVRFGFEMALWNLYAAAYQCIPGILMNHIYDRHLEVQALLAGSPEEMREQIQQRRDEGYNAFKLKVGRNAIDADIQTVQLAREWVGPQAVLRLDANRAWDLDAASTFGRAIANCDVDYIEEPLQDPQHLTAFYEATGVPVALDESLAEYDPFEAWHPVKGVNALVLKPNIQGSWRRTMQWALRARRYQLKAVFSSTFETGLGLAFLAQWAAALQQDDVAIGLDTGRWFAHDLLVSPKLVNGGVIDIHQAHANSLVLREEQLVPFSTVQDLGPSDQR